MLTIYCSVFGTYAQLLLANIVFLLVYNLCTVNLWLTLVMNWITRIYNNFLEFFSIILMVVSIVLPLSLHWNCFLSRYLAHCNAFPNKALRYKLCPYYIFCPGNLIVLTTASFLMCNSYRTSLWPFRLRHRQKRANSQHSLIKTSIHWWLYLTHGYTNLLSNSPVAIQVSGVKLHDSLGRSIYLSAFLFFAERLLSSEKNIHNSESSMPKRESDCIEWTGQRERKSINRSWVFNVNLKDKKPIALFIWFLD